MMKKIVKMTYTCPEGAVTQHQYHVLDERETEALLEVMRQAPYSYMSATIIGVVEPMGGYIAGEVERVLSESNK